MSSQRNLRAGVWQILAKLPGGCFMQLSVFPLVGGFDREIVESTTRLDGRTAGAKCLCRATAEKLVGLTASD